MLRSLSIAALLSASFLPGSGIADDHVTTAAYTNRHHVHRVSYRHRERHPARKTFKRVGVGAAGGAAVGALAGGPRGAAIGAIAGGGAGAIYDHHEKRIGK